VARIGHAVVGGKLCVCPAFDAKEQAEAYIATLDENLWAENFSTDNPVISITVTGLSGSVYLDAAWFQPMTRYNGTWILGEPGSTPARVGDTAVFNDVIPSDSVIQKLIFFGYGPGFYLPHDPAPTVTDP